MSTPEDQLPPIDGAQAQTVTPEMAAYLNASQHLVQANISFVMQAGFCGPNQALAHAIGSMQGNLMVRDLEMTALVQALDAAKLLDKNEFFKRFASIAAHVAEQLRKARETPQILVASGSPRPRGA